MGDRARLGGLDVVHDAGSVVVLAKPAGMPSEMRADTRNQSLLERVKADGWPDARLPHRLDKVTSGLQVVARDADTVAAMNEAMQRSGWDKRYVARVGRHASSDDALPGQHHRYLRREGRRAVVVRSGGKPARLDVEVVAADPQQPDLAQVLVRLVTGRYHQIRVMLADLGWPLVGDDRYGGSPDSDGPWLEHARLSFQLPDATEVGVVLPVQARRFPYADAIRNLLD